MSVEITTDTKPNVAYPHVRIHKATNWSNKQALELALEGLAKEYHNYTGRLWVGELSIKTKEVEQE